MVSNSYKLVIILSLTTLTLLNASTSLLKLTVPTPSSTLYPLMFNYEGQMTLMTSVGIYNVTIDESTGITKLVRANNIFDSRFNLDITMNDVHKVEELTTYFFPNINGNVLLKTPFMPVIELNSEKINHRISSGITGGKYGYFTYVDIFDENYWTAYISVYDIKNAEHVTTKSLAGNRDAQETFACMFISSYSMLECLFYSGNLYLAQFVFEPDFDFKIPVLVLSVEPIKAIKFDFFNEKFFGFAWKEEGLPLLSLIINVYQGSPSGGYSMNTNFYCSDLDSLEVLALTATQLTLVCCAFKGETLCEVYDEWLIGNGITELQNTHLTQMRVKFNVDEPTKLQFIAADPLNFSTVYYTVIPVYVCSNVEYEINTNAIVVDLREVVEPKGTWNDNDGGVYFYTTYNAAGKLEEVDRNGNVIGIVEYENTKHFYSMIKYTPIGVGRTSLTFKVYMKVFGDFYLPSNSCQIDFAVACYDSCNRCSERGNANEHLCEQCKNGYYFIEGKSNCYNTVPHSYYLDQNEQVFKRCPQHCEVCEDGNSCSLCNDMYTFLHTYTNNIVDVDCVRYCDVSKHKWYVYRSSTSKQFVCLEGGINVCPIEYSCLIKETNECVREANASTECRHEVPEVADKVEIFSYLKENILSYYEEEFIDIQSNQTVSVYDTTESVNDKFGLSNLTLIDLGECETKLKLAYGIPEDEGLIVAQIDKIEPNYPVNSISFLVFSKNGTLLDFSICQRLEINVTYQSSNNMTSHFITDQQMQMLQSQHINIFNAQDDFFNDRCTPYATKNSNGDIHDVPLELRRDEFFANVSLCDDTACRLASAEELSGKIKCICTIEGSSETVGEIMSYTSKKEKIPTWKELTFINIDILKCTHLLIKKNILINNIGFYILTSLIAIQIINYIFYFCVKEDVFGRYITSDGQWNNRSPKCSPPVGGGGRNSLGMRTDDGSSTNNNNNILFHINSLKQSNHIKVSSNNQLLSLTEKNDFTKSSNTFDTLQTHQILDFLSLQYAVSLEKRSFCALYLLRLKRGHPLYLMIKERKPFYFRNITISLFIFHISSDCFLNALFYTDSYIISNYNMGNNMFREIPRSIFTMLISLLLNIICGIFGKSEIKIRKRNKIEDTATYNKKYLNRMTKVRNSHTVFYIIVFVLSLFYWYYVSLFCAVYQYSQVNWLVGTVISTCLGLIMPFILCLISVLFRLKGIENRSERMFRFSKVVEAMH